MSDRDDEDTDYALRQTWRDAFAPGHFHAAAGTGQGMRFAYADPPYPGQAKKHYADHPDYAGEVDHTALIERLMDEYPDGWALSTNPSCLRWLLPLCPEKHRLLVWGKTFAAWKRNHWPAYAWEPVIMVGGRSLYGQQETPRDWIAEPITMRKGVSGAKPLAYWPRLQFSVERRWIR